MTEQEWMGCANPARMLSLLRGPITDCEGGPLGVSDRRLRLFACALCRQPEVWEGVECERCGGSGKRLYGDAVTFVDDCNECHGTGRVGGLTDEWSQRAVIIAERNVDRLDEHERMVQMHRQAFRVSGSERPGPAMAAAECCNPDALRAAQQACQLPTCANNMKAALLREVVGNPYRKVTLPTVEVGRKWVPTTRLVSKHAKVMIPATDRIVPVIVCPWLTHADGRVLKMARAIYDSRRWEEMPILADALSEAGCEDEAILRHLRGEEWSPPTDSMGRTKAIWIPLRGPHTRGCWVLDLLLNKE